MANSKSAKKRILVAERNRVRNQAVKTRVKTMAKKVLATLELKDVEAAKTALSVAYKTTIEIPMEEAYGDYDEELVEELTKADFADFEDIYEGMEFVVELEDESEMVAVITEIDGDKVYTDSNHPFSGRNLLFEVEVADVREATDEELDHGHVHEYENEE